MMNARILSFLGILAYGYGEENGPVERLYLSNGLDRGDWGPTDLCMQNSWVSTFEIKYSTEGHIDNTGMNAVRLYCQDRSGSMRGSVISSEGSFGEWEGLRSCKSGQFMVGMRADVMPDQGTFGDDEGVVNLEMRCSDGTILNGRYGLRDEEQQKEEDNVEILREKVVINGREMEAVHLNVKVQDSKTGKYSLWATCSGTNRICGLQSQLEHESTFTDDAGLCNIIMYCCHFI